MFDGLNYITLYWLSGFGEPKYEIWEAKKATISRTPASLSFSLYLAWPLEEADEGHVIIRKRTPASAWKPIGSPKRSSTCKPSFLQDQEEMFLKGVFERENIFIHFHE